MWRNEIFIFKQAEALVVPWSRSLGFRVPGEPWAIGKWEASEKWLPVSRPTAENRSNRLATLLRRAIIARL